MVEQSRTQEAGSLEGPAQSVGIRRRCLQSLIILQLYASDLEVWTRASKDDWDRFANFTEDYGWSWDEMLPYMKKVSVNWSAASPRDRPLIIEERAPRSTPGPSQHVW